MKQISLTLPENLFNLSKEHSQQYGYRSIQEFIVELVRRKVVVDNLDRYNKIKQQMEKDNVKEYSQAEAKAFLDSF